MLDEIGVEAEATRDDPIPEGIVWTRPKSKPSPMTAGSQLPR